MLGKQSIDRICAAVMAAALIATLLLASLSGTQTARAQMGYENRLFDTARVHTLDIVMDDWAGFLETCTNEEYAACSVVIDGENVGTVGLRAKGNTSLSSVASYGNDRYSFKIEFDHYQSGKTYHGLDKLSLNNLIQDKTFLKDYLAYTLMGRMGVAAPLCSFVQVNVNGEAWGLYLAVEAVEDSFLRRNYGANHGELYKPDSMSFGGGRGNGRDFDMEDMREQFGGEMGDVPGNMGPPEGFTFEMPPDFQMPDAAENRRRPEGGFGGGGPGSSDVKLQYIDDDPDSYPNIFSSAKTPVTEADGQRLIASLKALSENDTSVVDAEAVIRYLAVHNFLCNDDSYTGMMVHNYYLYEENGVLSMIPWDYNLAFGGFGMGSGATSTINAPIDSPVSMGDVSDRPMVAWIFENEAYTQRYHEVYQELADWLGGWLDGELERMSALIAPYVQADTNAFFSYDDFTNGVTALRQFCALRLESIQGQLGGSIPATQVGQRANAEALVDGSQIDLSDLGEFGMGGGRGERPSFPAMNTPQAPAEKPQDHTLLICALALAALLLAAWKAPSGR